MSSPEEQIQQMLKTNPVIEELVSGFDDVKEMRQVFEMDEKGAATNFTITQLANPQCFAVPPLTLTSVKAETAIAIHYIGPGMAGHPGIVHGGVIATILDECSGKAATTHFEAMHNKAMAAEKNGGGGSFNAAEGVLAVTARMAIDFKAPTRSDCVVVTRARADQEQSSARKANVTAEMWQQSADPASADKYQVVASGSGLFIRPSASV